MTLFGQANWIEPADTRGGFCDTAEGVAKMRWQLQGTHLVLSSVGTDPCGRAGLPIRRDMDAQAIGDRRR